MKGLKSKGITAYCLQVSLSMTLLSTLLRIIKTRTTERSMSMKTKLQVTMFQMMKKYKTNKTSKNSVHSRLNQLTAHTQRK